MALGIVPQGHLQGVALQANGFPIARFLRAEQGQRIGGPTLRQELRSPCGRSTSHNRIQALQHGRTHRVQALPFEYQAGREETYVDRPGRTDGSAFDVCGDQGSVVQRLVKVVAGQAPAPGRSQAEGVIAGPPQRAVGIQAA